MTPKEKQILSVIAAVAILAGGYVWATKYRTTSPQPPPESKTYRSEKYGFEFQYPKNWDYILDEDTACFKEQGKEYVFEEANVCGIAISAGKINPNRLGIDELVSLRKQSNPNLVVTRFRIDSKADSVRMQKYGDETYFDYGGSAFVVSSLNTEAGVAPVINQILSTFKFTK